jgi:hypothetical protein
LCKFFNALAPWGAMFVLSGTVAFGLNQALVRGPIAHSAAHEELEQSIARTWSSRTAVPTEPGATWVIFSSVEHPGVRTTLACLTAADRFAADILELDPVDMDRLAASLHCYGRS